MRSWHLIASAGVGLFAVHAGCSLPDYVYDNEAFARAQGGGSGQPGGQAGSGQPGGQGGAGPGGAGHSGTGGVSGHAGKGGATGGGAGQASSGGSSGAGTTQGGAGQAGAGQAGSGQGGAAGNLDGGHGNDGGSTGMSGSGQGGDPGGSGPGGSGGDPGGSGSGGAGSPQGGSPQGGSPQGGSPQGGSGGASPGDQACTVAKFTFDQCPGSFTSVGSKAAWACGAPSAGPGKDHTTGSGALWAVNLNGKPKYCEDSYIQSPPIDLSKLAGKSAKLRFWFWGEFSGCNPNNDAFGFCKIACPLSPEGESGGVLEVNTGGTWQIVAPVGGYPGDQKILVDSTSSNGGSGGTSSCQQSTLEEQKAFSSKGPNKVWTQAIFDVTNFVSSSFQFRLHFASAEQDPVCFPAVAGWFVDDIDVGSDTPCP